MNPLLNGRYIFNWTIRQWIDCKSSSFIIWSVIDTKKYIDDRFYFMWKIYSKKPQEREREGARGRWIDYYLRDFAITSGFEINTDTKMALT